MTSTSLKKLRTIPHKYEKSKPDIISPAFLAIFSVNKKIPLVLTGQRESFLLFFIFFELFQNVQKFFGQRQPDFSGVFKNRNPLVGYVKTYNSRTANRPVTNHS